MAESRTFSPSAGWDEVRRLLGRETRLLAAIAGVFFLLPATVGGIYSPSLEDAATFGDLLEAFRPYLPMLFLFSLVQMVGQLAIWSLVLSPHRPTVGEAIIEAARLLPYFFLANLSVNLAILLGLVLLILPGIYVALRLAPFGAVLVAERERWPAGIFRRSFEVTRGNALPIFAFVLIVLVVYIVVTLVVTAVAGTILALAGLAMEPGGAGAALLAFATGLVSAAGTTVFTLMQVAIYRQLAGDPSVPRTFA